MLMKKFLPNFFKLSHIMAGVLLITYSMDSFANTYIPDNGEAISNVKIGNLYYDLYLATMKATVVKESQVSENYAGLTEIDIPDTVEYEGKTFKVAYVGEEAFSDCNSLISVSMGNSVEFFGYQAFAYCPNLVNIQLSNSITFLNEEVFRYCTSLKSIVLPSALEVIDVECFEYCTSLENIDIPNTVIKIDNAAFRGCTSLENIILPESLTQIGTWVFEECENLSSIILYALEPPMATYDGPSYYVDIYDFFDLDIYNNCILNVPSKALELYKTTEPWSNFVNIKAINEEITPEISYFEQPDSVIPMPDEDLESLSEVVISWSNEIIINEENTISATLNEVPVQGVCDDNLLKFEFSDLLPGEYTLYVPEKYIKSEVITEDSFIIYYNLPLTLEYNLQDTGSLKLEFNTEDSTYEIYDLNGRRIIPTQNSDVLSPLNRGLYIVNGKKVFIKR